MKLKTSFYLLLILVLAGALYIRYNPDKVYSAAGDYFFRHNNLIKAQYFYDKSFELGNNNPEQRVSYVNSLINSPLDVEAQERLVKIAESDINDEASAKARYFLYELKRNIHAKYPLNYIKQAPFNQKVVRWSKLPITYTFKNSNNVPESFISEINKAFGEWEKQGVVLFTEVKNQSANITVEFCNAKQEDVRYGQKYVIAYTTPQININKLEGMNIKFYTHKPDGSEYTPNQIYNTALHEIFHALGFMGHSFNKNNVMYLASDNNTMIKDKRLMLTEADRSTFELLYKIEPDITNSGKLKSEYLPYLVLGDDEELNYSKAREAKNYIRQAPTLPSGYIDLAESYVAQKKYPEAVKSLEKALTLADTNDLRYIIYYNLAVSYLYINHAEMSFDYVKQAMAIKDSEELHYILAEIYTRKGDIKNAETQYKYLISRTPSNIDYTINLANIYVKKYDYLKARKVLKSFLKNNPKERGNKRLSAYGILRF